MASLRYRDSKQKVDSSDKDPILSSVPKRRTRFL